MANVLSYGSYVQAAIWPVGCTSLPGLPLVTRANLIRVLSMVHAGLDGHICERRLNYFALRSMRQNGQGTSPTSIRASSTETSTGYRRRLSVASEFSPATLLQFLGATAHLRWSVFEHHEPTMRGHRRAMTRMPFIVISPHAILYTCSCIATDLWPFQICSKEALGQS